MTDKIQKIKDWISCQQDSLIDANGNFQHSEDEAVYYTLCNLDAYIDFLQEEPVSEGLEEATWQYYDRNKPLMPPELDLHKELIDFFKAGARWKEQNDSNLSEVLVRDNLYEMAEEYSSCTYLEEVLGEGDREVLKARLKNTFKAGAKWQKEHLWKDAQGDDLPEIDKDVIVLTQPYPLEGTEYVVSFAHRPYKEKYIYKNLTTGNIDTFENETYDEGGWNIPDVKWWLDVDLPKTRGLTYGNDL